MKSMIEINKKVLFIIIMALILLFVMIYILYNTPMSVSENIFNALNNVLIIAPE